MLTGKITTVRVPTIERKIYFYHIVPANRADQLTTNYLISTLDEIEVLDWNLNGRYMETADGNSVCMWCDLKRPQIRLKLGTRRTTGLPDVETQGKLSPLSIAPDSGLSELTHMIIFPDNVVGAEFNFFGPRAQRLTHYLDMKTKNTIPTRLQILLQRDIEERITHFRNISIVRLRFRRSDLDLIAEMDKGGLSKSFGEILKESQAPLIEIVLRNNKYSKVPLRPSTFETIKTLAVNKRSKEVFDKFEVKGFNEETHRPEDLDILGDMLISRRQVIKQGPKQRNINDDSMYGAINESCRTSRCNNKSSES